MRPVINERYETMFRWLAKQYLEKYSNLSNKFLYELYIKANNLKETVNNFWKLLKDMAEMIRDEDMVLRPMDHTICKFRSENGGVVFQGNQIRQPKNKIECYGKVKLDGENKMESFNSSCGKVTLSKIVKAASNSNVRKRTGAPLRKSESAKRNKGSKSPKVEEVKEEELSGFDEAVTSQSVTVAPNPDSSYVDGRRTKVVLQHQFGKCMQHPSHAAISDFQSLVCGSDYRQFRVLMNNRDRCFKQMAEYQKEFHDRVYTVLRHMKQLNFPSMTTVSPL
ncbi:unnamed protein product [Caenorhabditis brenneri]